MPKIRSLRKPGYDYTQPGAYFITICSHGQQPLFGQVEAGQMVLSPWGEVVVEEWERTAELRPSIKTDAFVVMPTHVHGVMWLHADPEEFLATRVEAQRAAPLHASDINLLAPDALSTIVRAYKSAVTRRVNFARGTPGARVWQENFFDHIVRSEEALHFIRRYIKENPHRWHLDKYNADAVDKDPWARELWDLLRRDAQERP